MDPGQPQLHENLLQKFMGIFSPSIRWNLQDKRPGHNGFSNLMQAIEIVQIEDAFSLLQSFLWHLLLRARHCEMLPTARLSNLSLHLSTQSDTINDDTKTWKTLGQ
jgi:hypothetical protein